MTSLLARIKVRSMSKRIHTDFSDKIFGYDCKVIKFHDFNRHKKPLWVCLCHCGENFILTSQQVKHTKQCAKCRYAAKAKKQVKDLTTLKLNNGTIALKIAYKQGKHYYWECVCGKCKNIFVEKAVYLQSEECSHLCSNCCQNMIGTTFGDNCVVIDIAITKRNTRYWLCRCACGKNFNCSTYRLKQVKCCQKCSLDKRKVPYSSRKRNLRKWRQAILKRDNYRCQISDRIDKLEVHHIYNYAKYEQLRTNIKNGITLTKELHDKFHSQYGRKNNNLRQLIEFIDEN